MVIKISKGCAPGGMVGYNMKKVEKGEAEILSSSMISNKDDKSLSAKDIIKSFEERISLNKRTVDTMTHISINPDPKESLANEMLSKIAEDYLEQLGYGDQPYVVFKHADIEREHIHVVVCNIDEKGKRIKNQFEKKRSNSIRISLENKYNLLKAEEQQQGTLYPIQAIYLKDKDKAKQIKDIATQLKEEYAFGSVNEYRSLLSLYNIETKIIGDEKNNNAEIIYGIKVEEKMQTPPISEKIINLKYNSIKEKADKCREEILKNCESPYRQKAMRTLIQTTNTLEELKKAAEKLKIEFVFLKTSEGRVYGVTVIDNKKKEVYKASSIGRDFAAKAFQKYFKEADKEESENKNEAQNPKPYLDGSINEPTHEELSEMLNISSTGKSPFSGSGSGNSYRPDKKKKKKKMK